MKEIFDWLREKMTTHLKQCIELRDKSLDKTTEIGYGHRIDVYNRTLRYITEAEAKLKEKEAELRANVIEEFAEAIIVKATEASEKVVFDGKLVGDALSLDCVSDMVLEIASQMKGEKEC